MAQRVIVPRMGQTMTEGLIAKWYVSDGDTVNEGDDIYELEYDKSTYTVQAKKPGVIKLLFEEGTTVPLGDAVAVILEGGEAFDAASVRGEYSVANAARGGAAAEETAVRPDGPESEAVLSGAEGGVLATPFVRSLARGMGIDIRDVARPGERVTREDLENYGRADAVPDETEEGGKSEAVHISPLARKVAERRNIDIDTLKPKYGARITVSDVKAAAEQKTEKHLLRGRREPLSGIRKSIADNMTQSYFTYPTVTLTTDANMSALQDLRDQMNSELEKDGIKITVTDMLVKAVAKALTENEIVNTSLADGEIIYHDQVNVGVAVALKKGLVVPVIKNADKLKLPEIANETKRLIDLAKSGRIEGEDMRGGTFTVTNLGVFGIDAFNPIINPPESAILGVGRTVKKPVVVEDQIVVQPRAVLSFTHDHRVIDGAPGAYFLQSVVRYIEKPFLLLLD